MSQSRFARSVHGVVGEVLEVVVEEDLPDSGDLT